MILSNRSHTSTLILKIGNSIIDRTATHKFLGIIIDETLTFASHVNKLCSIISRSTGIIRKLSYLVPRKVLRKLYFAFICSHFTYGLTTWGSVNRTFSRRVSGLIDRSVKLVTCASGNTVEICKNNKIMNLSLAYNYFCCIKMYQVIIMKKHAYFNDIISSFQIDHNHFTRRINNEQFTLPFFRYVKCQKSFLYSGMKIWNDLPINLRSIEKLNRFKAAVKGYLLT